MCDVCGALVESSLYVLGDCPVIRNVLRGFSLQELTLSIFLCSS